MELWSYALSGLRSGQAFCQDLGVKNKLLALLFLAAGILFAQVSIGVGITIGAPPPPRIVKVRPVAPGPDFLWVEGYWYPVGGHYKWHDGYWTKPPYVGAHWVAPRHDGRQFFAGFWDGEHGRIEHDHAWDKDHAHRDFGHDRH